MPRTTGPSKLVEVREKVLTIEGICISMDIAIDRATLLCSRQRQRLLKSRNVDISPQTCKKTDGMNLSCTRLEVTVRRQKSYNTGYDGLDMRARMTPSTLHSIYPITLSDETRALRNSHRALLPGSSPSNV